MDTSLYPIRLYPVKRLTPESNRYCGPAVLSILTGLDTDKAAQVIKDAARVKVPIRAVPIWWMDKALKVLGLEAQFFPTISAMEAGQPPLRRITFGRWEKRSRKRRANHPILLNVGSHWVIVKGQRCVCGLTGKQIPIKLSRRLRARVWEAYQIVRI